MSQIISRWRRSSHSDDITANCVEVAGTIGGVAVRDSKNPAGPVLSLTCAQWEALLSQCRK